MDIIYPVEYAEVNISVFVLWYCNYGLSETPWHIFNSF